MISKDFELKSKNILVFRIKDLKYYHQFHYPKK